MELANSRIRDNNDGRIDRVGGNWKQITGTVKEKELVGKTSSAEQRSDASSWKGRLQRFRSDCGFEGQLRVILFLRI